MRSITAKVGLLSSSCVVVVAAVLIWSASRQASALGGQAARDQVRSRAREQAENAGARLRRALDIARALSQVLGASRGEGGDPGLGREDVHRMLQAVLAENPWIDGVFTGWEPGVFGSLDEGRGEPPGGDEEGRFMPFWYRSGGAERSALLADRDPEFLQSHYPRMRTERAELLTPPRQLSSRPPSSWSVTAAAPIVAGGRFRGVVGVEVGLDFLRELCQMASEDEVLVFFGPQGRILASSPGADSGGGAPAEAPDTSPPRPSTAVQLSEGYFVAREAIDFASAGDSWGVTVKLPVRRVAEATRGVVWSQVWRSLLVVAVALVASQVLSWRMTKNIVEVTRSLKEISEGTGDLTQRLEVRSSDEVGRLAVSFNTFVEKVQSIVLEVSGSADEVATSASEIAESSEELAGAIVRLGGQVSEVSSQASDAAAVAERGRGIVQETISRMDSIHRMISRAAESIDQLGEQSQQITNVVKVISGFTQQTDLLALNAGVEAARAGDAGRGFRVVAEEIKELANQTSRSAVEIGETIDTIYARTLEAVSNMSGGTDALEEGCRKAKEAYESLESIVENALRVLGRVQHITGITLQLRGGVEQSAAAASGLSSRADALRRIVASFKLCEEGR